MRLRSGAEAALLLALVAAQPATASSWSFEGALPGWAQDVIAEPGSPSNRVLYIAAKQPHHTRITVPEPVPAAFVAEARVRLYETTGTAPLAYLYGLTPDGFLALSLGSGRTRLFVWRGNNQPSPVLGETSAPASTGGWMRVKLALENGVAAAKVWPDGMREPGWTLMGQAQGLTVNRLAVGAWLSPREPAAATLFFDDLKLRPAMPEDRVAELAEPAAPLALPAATVRGVFEAGPHIGLVAGDLVVAFDRRNGSLRHLMHRPTGRDFSDPLQRRPLFRLRLTRWQAGETAELSADDFKRVLWETSDPSTLRATFRDGSVPGLAVRATVSSGADGLAHFRLAVENPSDRAVAAIRFPGFASPPALGGDAADDRLLVPHSHTDGIVINAPGRLDRSAGGAYPGDAAVQMAALYDPAAGLLIATHDAEGHCKAFDVRMSRDRFVELSVTHLRPEMPGPAETPYDTVLGTFTGDWRDAADLYKRWARNQPWCARKLALRDDVPAFLKEGSAGIILGIGSADGYNGSLGPDLEKLPALVADYRRRAKVPHLIAVPYGWENRGTWAGIHYLPARPSDEAWRAANEALRAQGDRTALLTSGYWWVIRRAKTSNGPAFDDTADFERRKGMTVHRADGTPWLLDAYDKAGTMGDWRGVSAKLCHGSAEARAEMLDLFLKTAALGTPLVSFDQEIGGGQSAPCYATGHGHPPGYGAWMWSDFRDLCEAIRKQARGVEPEIGLLVENCGEMIIPVMATYWSRQFGVLDQGSSGEGPVGLFSYLYHDYVTAMGAAVVQGQGPQGAKVSAGLRCQALANNLARGLIPCPFSNDVPLETRDVRKAQIARAFFAFCEPFGTFPEFLVLGETLRPPAITCAEREEWYEPKPGGTGRDKSEKPERRATRPLPAVIAGRFAAPDGAIATILVNAMPETQCATFMPIESRRPATLHRADKSVDMRWPALPDSLSVTLEPFGTRILVVP
jgi:hypothetical protein